MAKKVCWAIIFTTLIINVVMLHFTIQAYYGLEYESVYLFTVIGILSAIISLGTFFYWRKLEY